jgi:hypothetical protein
LREKLLAALGAKEFAKVAKKILKRARRKPAEGAEAVREECGGT